MAQMFAERRVDPEAVLRELAAALPWMPPGMEALFAAAYIFQHGGLAYEDPYGKARVASDLGFFWREGRLPFDVLVAHYHICLHEHAA